MTELILLVDDEPSIVQLARMYLEREGFRVQAVGDGEAALEAVSSPKGGAAQRPALIVLDVMLPKLDGFEVCRRLRARGDPVAILMLTARDDDVDKIVGLELGADDYLTKPFNPRELVARVKAILRRERRLPAEAKPVTAGDLVVDPLRREARLGDRSLDLRAQEFDLLLILAGQPGRVFTREQLLQQAWGFDFYGQTRTVDVHIAHLRKKMEGGEVKIETVTGVGYKLVVPSPPAPLPGGEGGRPSPPAPVPGGEGGRPSHPASLPGGEGGRPSPPAPVPGGEGGRPSPLAPARFQKGQEGRKG